jgi:hypothetical protein
VHFEVSINWHTSNYNQYLIQNNLSSELQSNCNLKNKANPVNIGFFSIFISDYGNITSRISLILKNMAIIVSIVFNVFCLVRFASNTPICAPTIVPMVTGKA